jgi:crotonobetainyl-CoA:carnitine CoA-transferase CaiB-like acyl-CoA transferase
MEYLSGITSVTGYGHESGDRPMRVGVYTVDPIGAMQATGAIIAALMYRRRTGKGMNIEVSQYEGAASFVNEAIMDYTMNKRIRIPAGNDDRDIPFQGCYPAKGDDEWIVFSIRNKKEWLWLLRIIGKEQWLVNDQYSDPKKAVTKRDEIDAVITSWTRQYSKLEIARLLQNVHIPAAPVNHTNEALFDPQLRHRNLFKWVKHPYGAMLAAQRMPAIFTKTPLPDTYEAARAVGEDNHYVYHELLKMSDEEINKLEQLKIIKR